MLVLKKYLDRKRELQNPESVGLDILSLKTPKKIPPKKIDELISELTNDNSTAILVR